MAARLAADADALLRQAEEMEWDQGEGEMALGA